MRPCAAIRCNAVTALHGRGADYLAAGRHAPLGSARSHTGYPDVHAFMAACYDEEVATTMRGGKQRILSCAIRGGMDPRRERTAAAY